MIHIQYIISCTVKCLSYAAENAEKNTEGRLHDSR
jgi:hypothetical protein